MTVRMIGRNRARGVAGIGDDGKLLASIIPQGANGFLVLDGAGKIAIATVASDGNDPNGIVLLDAGGKVLASLIPQGANGFLVLDGAGKIAVATVASDGNDANGILLLDASAQVAEALLAPYYLNKTGYEIIHNGTTTPTGYLPCLGSYVNSTTYATLRQVMYPTGNPLHNETSQFGGFVNQFYTWAIDTNSGATDTEPSNWPTGTEIKFTALPAGSTTLAIGNIYYHRYVGIVGGYMRMNVYATYQDAIDNVNYIVNDVTGKPCTLRNVGSFKLPNTGAGHYVRYI